MNDLLIGGGGVEGIMFIGALDYLHENNLLDLKRFHGCSIGSLIGILYISGWQPKKILNIVMTIEMSELVKYDFSNMATNQAILNDNLLESLVSNIENYDTITLGKFTEKYSVDINIYVTNVTKNLYTNLNNLETPEIKLKDAIMASMSIPFLFPPVKIGDSYYIDGCCKNISGSPPLDICILGYSIILSGTNIAYISRVIRSIANNWAPNSLYTITCSGKMSSRDIVNVDSILTHSRILELYKTGIRCSREQINHGTENFKTWE